MLDRLLYDLYSQILWRPRQVEIIVENGNGTRGTKRQRVLDRARGHFVCFVDDDDGVSSEYVDLVSAIVADPEADCVSLVGEMTTDGANPERFEHSIKYSEWSTVDGVHRRCPNHLNPVRTSIARSVGFSSADFGEDREYSLNLRGKLKREGSTDGVLYYYRYKSRK
jgi:glycosyltransferase involved in cell wall biosynthesis